MSDLIDLKSHRISAALNLLLKDRTTKRNIIFATEAYAGIDFTMPITKKLLADLEKEYPGLRQKIVGAMERGKISGWHE